MMRVSHRLALASICCILAIMLLLPVSAQASRAEDITVMFEFTPAKDSYKQAENFTIDFTIYNSLMNISGFPNDVKVTNLSAHFSWMAPNQWLGTDVSSGSSWLVPGESGVYGLNMSVPANASAHSYSYILKVKYDKNDAWGTTYGIEWVSQPYADFSVTERSSAQNDGATVNWPVFIAGLALVVALGSIGAVFYYKREQKGTVPPVPAQTTQTEAQPTSGS